jgi:hypothetical protein
MKYRVAKNHAHWHVETGRVELEAGAEVEAAKLHSDHVRVGVREGWLQSTDDDVDGAPPREKAAARRAPERK